MSTEEQRIFDSLFTSVPVATQDRPSVEGVFDSMFVDAPERAAPQVPPPQAPPQADMENPYFSSPQFQGILEKAQAQGLENLTKSEQGQISKAMELGLVPQDAFTGQEPQLTSRQQLIQPLTEVFRDAAQQFAAAGDKGFLAQSGAFTEAFMRGVDSLMSKEMATGIGQDFIGKDISQALSESLADVGLDYVEPGKEREIFNPITEEIEKRKITKPEAVAYNFVLGATRLAPELLTQFMDNPYDFFSGLVKFPVEEAKLILDAANIDIDLGKPTPFMVSYGMVDSGDVEKARDELIRSPFGVAMLGMLAIGARGKMAQALKAKAEPTYATVRTEGIKKANQEIVDLSKKVRDAEAPDVTVSGIKGKIKDFPDVVLNEEVAALRSDLKTSEIAALDRKTRESIVLAEELPGAAKAEIEALKAERVVKKPPVEKPGKQPVKLEPEKGPQPKEGAPLPKKPVSKMTQKEFDQRQKRATDIEKSIRETEQAIAGIEAEIPGVPPKQKPGLQKTVKGLQDRLEREKAEFEKSRLPEGVEIIEEPKPAKPPKPTLDDVKARMEAEFERGKKIKEEFRKKHPELVREAGELDATFDGIMAEELGEKAHLLFTPRETGGTINIQRKDYSPQFLKQKIDESVAKFRGEEPPVEAKPKKEAPKEEPETPEKALVEEGIPAKNETPFSEAELAMIDKSRQGTLQRNLSDSQELVDWKREIQRQEAVLRKPGATKEDIVVADKVIQKAKSRIKKLESDIAERNAERPQSESVFAGKQQFKMEKVEKLDVDTERFQGRFEPFSEESVKSIVSDFELGHFDPNNFDPIHVWKDPVTGKRVVLAGHSRLEALKRLKIDEIPIIERDFKTEAEAVRFAKDLSNRLSQAEGLASDIRAFKRMEGGGSTTAELQARFGKNYGDLKGFAGLDPNGKFIQAMTQRAFEDAPYVKKWGRAVGEIRKEIPGLTDLHERQIFDQLYPAERSVGLFDKIKKDDLRDMIDKQTTDTFWSPEMPIKLKKDPRPMRGDRARSDTGPLVRKYDEAKKRRDQAATPQELEYWKREMERIEEGIRTLVKDQGTLFGDEPGSPTFTGGEGGFARIPNAADFGELGKRVWNTMDKVTDQLKVLRNAALMPPVTARGVTEALEAGIRHRQRVSDAKAVIMQLRAQFKEWAPDQSRWENILHATQQGPKSTHWADLTPTEKKTATWLREELKQMEKFALDAKLIDAPRSRLEGHVYVPQLYVNPKTGKPFATTYGEFSQASPRLQKKKYETYEAAMGAGFKPTTKNVGEMIGLGYESLFRAHAARKLYQDLHNTTYSTDIRMPTKKGSRDLMMVESWKDLVENGLQEGYVIPERSFLDKPMIYRDAKGNTRILDQKVAMREEIVDRYNAYTANYRLSSLGKLLYIAKSFKLMGVFHPMQLGIQQAANRRIPFTGIKKGLKLFENPDETMRGLIRNGLRVDSYKDLGVSPVEVLRLESKNVIAKAGNIALWLPRQSARLTFDVAHKGMKATHAYETYNRIAPKYEYLGIDKEVAYRDAVKMADNIFSGPDYKRAILETNRLAFRVWYSAGMRRFWQNGLISPSWQESHVKAFYEVNKSMVPNKLLRTLRLEPNRPIAQQYRMYLAGAISLYSAANLYNWAMTKHMDGEAKWMWQNEKGKEFRVRLPYDNPDGTAAYVMPFKSIFEVPEALADLYGIAKGEGDLHKFTSKLAPYWSAAIKQFYNVDSFGRKIYDENIHPGHIGNRTWDFTKEVFGPISVTQVIDALIDPKKHDISAIIGPWGFPVSKGYPGGELGRMIDEYKVKKRAERKPTIEEVDNLIVEGKTTEAIFKMALDLNWTDAQIGRRLGKYKNRLLEKWESKTWTEQDRYFFIKALSEEDQKKLFNKLRERK